VTGNKDSYYVGFRCACSKTVEPRTVIPHGIFMPVKLKNDSNNYIAQLWNLTVRGSKGCDVV